MCRGGEIRWQGDTIYITAALAGEPVGLLENDDGSWSVSYGPIDLGVIAHGDNRLCKPKPCVDHMPTGATTTAARLNKTGNVLPMSSVRSVTHVPGCAHPTHYAFICVMNFVLRYASSASAPPSLP